MTTTFGDHPHTATLQVPTGDPNGSKHQIPCTVESIDGKRLMLETPERLGISTAVSVEYNDSLFLGEVIGCRSGGEDIWRMDIKVEQILTGLQNLMALRAGLLGELSGERKGADMPVNVLTTPRRLNDLN